MEQEKKITTEMFLEEIGELREGKFCDYLRMGKQMDKRRILYLLVEMYMENCGISITYRSLVYDFAWSVFMEYAKNEQTEFTGEEAFYLIMSKFHPEYSDEEYFDYEVLCIKENEYPHLCMKLLEEENYDSERCAAICYGFNCLWEKMKKNSNI